VAREKRAAFRDWDYWGRPMQGFGDPGARVLILGLAPAAHGLDLGHELLGQDLGADALRVAAAARLREGIDDLDDVLLGALELAVLR
jgi:hypothetical protein